MDAAWSVKTTARVPLSLVCESHIHLARAGNARGPFCSNARGGDPPDRPKVTFHLSAIRHIIAGLMANSEESQTIPQSVLRFQEERTTGVGKPASAARRFRLTDLWSRLLSQEWSSALLYLFLDVVSWLTIYRVAGWFRFDAFYATPFQFFIVNVIQLGVIVAALYFVGGYDRTVEKLT